MIADEVREMLQRQAATVQPSPDAWERIAERLDAGDAPVMPLQAPFGKPARRRQWFMPTMAVAAVAALVVAAAVVLTDLRDEPGDRIQIADPPGPEVLSTPSGPAASKPIWPVTHVSEMADRTDLGDPADVARRYLADRLPGAEAGAFEASENGSNGIVPFTNKGVQGQVQLGKTVNDAWFVTGAGSSVVDVHMLGFDGRQVTGEAMPTVSGSMRLTVSRVGGGTPFTEQEAVTAGKPVSISMPGHADAESVILTVRLGDGFGEYRVERPGSAFSPDAPTAPEAKASTDEEAVRNWLRAVADGDVDGAWAMVDDRSRQAVGGYEKFNSMQSELAEGWGGWAEAKDAAYYTIQMPTPGVSVVVVTGVWGHEGPHESTGSAMVVRKGRVDPFVNLGDVSFGAADATWVDVTVPTGRDVWFIVDDRGPIRATVSGTRATASIEPPLEPGRHVLGVVLGRNGAFAVRTFDYQFK